MKAVMLDVPEQVIEDRRRKGLDARDEVWEGVLHMVQPPSWDHQDILDGLVALLRPYIRKHGLGAIASAVGIRMPGSGASNFRVPDAVFLARGHETRIDSRRTWVEGAADVVWEVRSPGDETDDKLPFYADLGVREVVIIDRDTRNVEILALSGNRYLKQASVAEGWLPLEAMRIRLRTSRKTVPPAIEVDLTLDGTTSHT
jgi:Uma2 family endonuclease